MDTGRLNLLKDTAEAVEKVLGGASRTGMEKWRPEVYNSLKGISHYFQQLYGQVNDAVSSAVTLSSRPEVGKHYSLLHPIKMARARQAIEKAREATEAAERTLQAIPVNGINEVYEAANKALGVELTVNVANIDLVTSGTRHRGGLLQYVSNEDLIFLREDLARDAIEGVVTAYQIWIARK